MSGNSATTEDFEKLDIRVSRVVEVQPFPEGRYSTHKGNVVLVRPDADVPIGSKLY